MKLSLLVQAWRDKIASDYDHYESSAYVRGCYDARIKDADELEAALAQQAQPLTDKEISDEASRLFANEPHYELGAVILARWVRDRMAQQAQPGMPKCRHCGHNHIPECSYKQR